MVISPMEEAQGGANKVFAPEYAPCLEWAPGPSAAYFAVGTQTASAYEKSTPVTSVVTATDSRPALLPGLAEKPSQY